ncbi:hypothetical protein ACAW49_08215 [Pseudomonas sp. Env-44]|uniref:hypothetical protein n=1 Tax=unclassified Pseudomonas TaxID=196821 RepID=UPI00351F924E
MINKRDLLALASDCFEAAKEAFISTGEPVTISAIAKNLGIDRKYFYGRIKMSDATVRGKWINLGREIKEFKAQAKEKKCINDSKVLDDAGKLRNALVENYALTESVEHLKEVSEQLKKNFLMAQQRVAELEAQIIEFQRQKLSQVPSAQTSIVRHLCSVISPDSFRKDADPLSMKKGWLAAMARLRSIIDTPGNKDLYITVGAPGSGKSSWCRKSIAFNKVSILFDACNLTKSDRYDFFDLLIGRPGIRIIAVVFCVSLDTLRDRNQNRVIGERLPFKKIKEMYESIEYPSHFDQLEVFDEIIMVR